MKNILFLTLIIFTIFSSSCKKEVEMKPASLKFLGAGTYDVRYTIPDKYGDAVDVSVHHQLLVNEPKEIHFNAQEGFVPEVEITNLVRVSCTPLIVKYYWNNESIFKKNI